MDVVIVVAVAAAFVVVAIVSIIVAIAVNATVIAGCPSKTAPVDKSSNIAEQRISSDARVDTGVTTA